MIARDVTTILIGIIALAALAVGVKPGSTSGAVMSSGFSGFGNLISTASNG
jgi:hypothetical protein